MGVAGTLTPRPFLSPLAGLRPASGDKNASAGGLVHAEDAPQHVADLAQGAGVGRDSIFRIASTTKPIVAVGALILVEECRLRLDDPVDDLLPELAVRRVLVDPRGPIGR